MKTNPPFVKPDDSAIDEQCSFSFSTQLARRLHTRHGYAPETANSIADAFLLGKGGRHEWS